MKTNLFIRLFSPRGFLEVIEEIIFKGFSKMPACKAPEIQKSEAYFGVRRNDEG